jgi:hypothetical protein
MKPTGSKALGAERPQTPGPADEGAESGRFAGWTRFWFSPRDPLGLHVVRLLTGLLLLAWLLPYAGDVTDHFGAAGWFDLQALKEAARLESQAEQDRQAGKMDGARVGPPKPVRAWSLLYPVWANPTLLKAFYWGSVAVLALFTLGVATRLTGVLTWLIVVSFTAGPAYENDLDPMLHMLAFYLALGYLLLGLTPGSLLGRIFGRRDTLLLGGLLRRDDEPAPSIAANLVLRLMQVHFAILIVVSGLHKLQIGDWWSGVAHWPFLYPAMGTTMAMAREHARDPLGLLVLLNAAAYATLAWQLALPLFAWRPGWWRLLLLGGAASGAAGLVLIYNVPLFAAAFAVACLAYLNENEWAAVGRLFRRGAAREEAGRPAFAGPHARELAIGAIQNGRER